MELKKYLVIGALSAGVLTGCGSDDDAGAFAGVTYNGATNAGSLNANTEAAYEVTAVEAAIGQMMVDETEYLSPLDFGFGPRSSEKVFNEIQAHVKELKLVNGNLPVGAQVVLAGECEVNPGSVTIATSDLTQEQLDSEFSQMPYIDGPIEEAPSEIPAYEPFDVTVTYTFANYCVPVFGPGMSMTLNGVSTEQVKSDSQYHYIEKTSLSNFTTTLPTEEGTLTLTWNAFYEYNSDETGFTETTSFEASALGQKVSATDTSNCVWNQQAETMECTNTTDFLGSNGVVYRVADNNTTYETTIYDPVHGYVVYQTPNMISMCDEGKLEAGAIIRLNDGVSQMTITATDCGVYDTSIIALDQL